MGAVAALVVRFAAAAPIDFRNLELLPFPAGAAGLLGINSVAGAGEVNPGEANTGAAPAGNAALGALLAPPATLAELEALLIEACNTQFISS